MSISKSENTLAERPTATVTGEQTKQPSGIRRRLERWLERDRWPSPEDTVALFTARLTDVGANRTARTWAERYLAADEEQRRKYLAGLVEASDQIEDRGDDGLRLYRRLYAQAESLQLLVQLRADMLRWRNQVAGLTLLERELQTVLSNWFDVGMLELRRISWDCPASLLEKLIEYEAVHKIRSWEDLRNRVADHRRCFAFFHPRMPHEPLIFVEVAFTNQMADNVQTLLDPYGPEEDPDKARWAIFYSISNTQRGLRGISFGNFLLKRVVEELLQEFPRLKGFATLSPIPGFNQWLSKCSQDDLLAYLEKSERKLVEADAMNGLDWLKKLQDSGIEHVADDFRKATLRLVGKYLKSTKNGVPIDPVARFHLGNGARIEQLNWGANVSEQGLQQSCGVMANYLYDLDQLDDNLAQLATGKIKTGRPLRWL